MISYFTLLVTIFILTTCSFDLEDKLSWQNNIISNVIHQFNEHNIIYHYDNTSIHRLDKICSKIQMNSSFLMINYDLSWDEATNTSKMIGRPMGYKFLHIVLLHNYSRFIEYTNTSRYSFGYLDIIFVLTNLNADNETATEEFKVLLYNVYRAGAFFILDVWSFLLYHVCFYCGKNFGKWQKIADLTDIVPDYFSTVKRLVQNIYENQFNDFNGHVFVVGYSIYEPFFWCYISVEDNITWYEVLGSEGSLLYVLHEKLNMGYDMEEIDGTNNISMNMIEAIRNGSIDWAVGGITTTISRSKLVDFTNYINIEPYVVLYSIYDDHWMSWLNIISPFQFGVWLILILSVIVISCLFFIAMDVTKINANYEFRYFFQGCLRLLVEQPLPRIRDAMKSRWSTSFLMALWLIVALILTNAFKSKLTSSLISSRAEEYDDADCLVELNYEFYVDNSEYSVIKEFLENSEDENFLTILNRSKIDEDFCSSVLLTSANKIAVIDEETNIQYRIQKECQESMTVEQEEDLRLLKYDLFPSQHAWPMPLNAPYRNSMNSVISRLHAAGIFNKWNNDYASTRKQVSKSKQNFRSSRNTFNVTTLIGPAILWSLGIIAASISFFIEILRGKKNKMY